MEKDFKLLETAADVFGGIPQLAKALGKKSQSLYAYKKPEMRIGRTLADDLHKLGFNRGYFLGESHRLFAEDETGKALQERVVREIQERGATDEEKSSIYLFNPNAKDLITAAKETKDTLSHNAPQNRQRWELVREWLTTTGTITEWYFLVQSHCDGVTLNDLLAVEAGEIDPPPVLALWVLSRGISLDWLIGVPEAPPFSSAEEGEHLEAKLRARYTQSTAPVEELFLV